MLDIGLQYDGYSYGGGYFQNAMVALESVGLTDVLLPFVLVFAICYAVLRLYGPFKAEEKNNKYVDRHKSINATISIAIALLIVIPHLLAPSPSDPVNIINRALPQFGLLIIAIVLLLIMAGMWTAHKAGEKSFLESITGWAPYVALVLLGIIFVNSLYPDYMPEWLRFLDDPALQGAIIAILVLALIVSFIIGGGEEGGGAAPAPPAAGGGHG